MRAPSIKTRTIIPAFCACLGLLAVIGQSPASAQRGSARKTHTQGKRAHRSARSASATRAQAWKRLKDYNYVKHFGPISGPMYRSTKW